MSSSQEPPKSGLSRREFLRSGGLAATASTGIAGAALQAQPAAGQPPASHIPVLGPGPAKITLSVNGRDMTAAVEPRVTLLDALRNYLDVTGCKRVCDRGTCGACTVLLDGKPVYSCSMLAVEAQGKTIRTAESLAPGEKLDPVPEKFVQFDAQQCGFCTPGFVVAMRAVLDRNPKATPEEIEKGLQGNICRCGTYEQMRDAIHSLCNRQRRS